VAAGVGAIEEDQLFEENARLDSAIDSYSHTILQQYQDPVEWKTELERVGPRLRANQQVSTNEWRSHVDQTINSKGQIEKVLGETQGTLQTMNK
jgi:estrogen-related receptor beta like 1